MSENVIQTLQHVIQDVIAPDLRELKVRVNSLEKQMDVRFDSIEQRLTAMEQKSDLEFKMLMSAISESRTQPELVSMRVISALSERVAILESQRH